MRAAAPTISADALAADLRAEVRGEVRFDRGSRALYSTDSSNYRQLPIGVVIPRDAEDVVRTVRAARAHDAPVLARGGGTSLAGQCTNTAVVVDCSKYMHAVLEVDRDRNLARVQPGAILDHLRDVAEAGEPSLTFGPDPSTHDRCTIGGMIGNNACGVHAVMSEFYGRGPRTSDNVHELDVLTYDGLRIRVGPTGEQELEDIIRAGGHRGQIYEGLRSLRDRYGDLIRQRFPDIPRRVSGFNLDELLPENGFNVARALVGSESTCVTVLEATVHLLPNRPNRALAMLGFRDVFAAADAVPLVREHRPTALEGFDDVLVENDRRLGRHADVLDRLPAGGGWLMVEFGGDTQEEANDRARGFMDSLEDVEGLTGTRMYEEPEEETEVWEVRESGLAATAFVPGEADAWPGWEDSAVPPHRLGDYLRELTGLFDRYGYHASVYGHFGQGCVHCRIGFDLASADGVATYRRFVDEAADLVVSMGGSISGEHGDGQARGELLEKMYGPDLVRAFREFKGIWDPEGRMNPGKVVDADPIVANLKLGPDYAPAQVDTHFSYPEDQGSFAHAALRCVGVGECRRMGGGTMCPSYMVTREEKHTTRGRARMLFEMMNGAEIPVWKSDEVFESLELCLACKGCKGDCPVSVDMATYKAEFLSHYYRGRLRPRAAYSLGLIYWWARIASAIPRVANFFTHAPGVSALLKRAGGVAAERDAPRFAERTFTDWFRSRDEHPRDANRTVVLWPDTFNNFFHPGTARAAVDVLEAAGYRVVIPDRSLCCGRPLYDYGMLDLAKKLLRRVLDDLAPHLRAGTPVIGVEPSCVAVFRDELPSLFPHDEDAERLSRQSKMLEEFLVEEGWEPPPLRRKALVHGHCHHEAIMGLDAERRMLDALGLDYEMPATGCCGMAGSFGFEAGEKYEVGKAAGERVLLPAVREAEDDTLIVADGFSCRTMVEQETDRRAVHLAEVIRMAIDHGPSGPRSARPEDAVGTAVDGGATRRRSRISAFAAGLGVVAGAAAWRAARRRRTRLPVPGVG